MRKIGTTNSLRPSELARRDHEREAAAARRSRSCTSGTSAVSATARACCSCWVTASVALSRSGLQKVQAALHKCTTIPEVRGAKRNRWILYTIAGLLRSSQECTCNRASIAAPWIAKICLLR